MSTATTTLTIASSTTDEKPSSANISSQEPMVPALQQPKSICLDDPTTSATTTTILTKTQLDILSNISTALKQDIELKRLEIMEPIIPSFRKTRSPRLDDPTETVTTTLSILNPDVLYNISAALKQDIELKRLELAALEAQQPSHLPQAQEQQQPTTPSPSPSPHSIPLLPTYCTARPPFTRTPINYQPPSQGRPCTCPSPHSPLHPTQWSVTPAEASPWDYSLLNGGHPERESRVRWKDEVVSEVHVFEKWWQEEYGEGVRKYWDVGPVRVSGDDSSVEDDDWEIEFLEGGSGDGEVGEGEGKEEWEEWRGSDSGEDTEVGEDEDGDEDEVMEDA